MKKEYVKPIIESEEFVANEYVAACWVGTCQTTHKADAKLELWQKILLALYYGIQGKNWEEELHLVNGQYDITEAVHSDGSGSDIISQAPNENPGTVTKPSYYQGQAIYHDYVYTADPNASY